jgi:hypothetical protein
MNKHDYEFNKEQLTGDEQVLSMVLAAKKFKDKAKEAAKALIQLADSFEPFMDDTIKRKTNSIRRRKEVISLYEASEAKKVAKKKGSRK